MGKRTYEQKIDHYVRKMERLRDKHRRKRRRLESSSSDQENQPGGEPAVWDVVESQPASNEADPGELVEPLFEPSPAASDIQLPPTEPPPSEQAATPIATSVPVETTLDPEILIALGESTDQGPTFGEEIHTNLSLLWQPLLKKGLVKETKEKILKQYLIPSNCTLLQAPKLNIEISAAVAEMVRSRDKKVEYSQQQLGIGITAISRALTVLLSNDDSKIEAIKILSDGCRILCDLHYAESQARVKMVTPGLAKPFLNVIQDSERDETLFGNSLPDKIKASKTIEKQGLQIKKSVLPRPMSVAQPQNTPARQQFQGNWAGPSRYPMNRGGRGGQRRFPVSARRTATPSSSTVTSQMKSSQGRSRAPARQ